MASEAELVPTVLTSVDDGIHRITLNRPERLNAFNVDMHAALLKAFEAARDDPHCRVVVLTGSGRAFSAGQDLSDRAVSPGGQSRDLGESLEKRYNPLIRLIRSMTKPVIAAVNGTAAGAGANIALACDIVIAAKSASFLQAFARIGLIPDSGGTFFLPRLVGAARAKGLALLAEPIGAERAAEWGLIWKAVDDNEFNHEIDALARRFAEAPTYGLGLTKLALNASDGNDLDAQLDMERDMQRLAGQSPDYAEGVSAFIEKRRPRFTGAGS